MDGKWGARGSLTTSAPTCMQGCRLASTKACTLGLHTRRGRHTVGFSLGSVLCRSVATGTRGVQGRAGARTRVRRLVELSVQRRAVGDRIELLGRDLALAQGVGGAGGWGCGGVSQ